MPNRFQKSVGDATNGLKIVFKEERNFRIQLVAALVVFAAAFALQFSFPELLGVTVAVLMVLLGEIVNTAVEDLCNKVEPQHDAQIGAVKDVMAAYVLLAAFGSVVLGVITVVHHFYF